MVIKTGWKTCCGRRGGGFKLLRRIREMRQMMCGFQTGRLVPDAKTLQASPDDSKREGKKGEIKKHFVLLKLS